MDFIISTTFIWLVPLPLSEIKALFLPYSQTTFPFFTLCVLSYSARIDLKSILK